MPTRHAIVAGQFYPSDPAELRREVARFFQRTVSASVVVPPEGREKGPGAGMPDRGAERSEADGPGSPGHPWSWDAPLLTMLPHAGYVYCGTVMAAALAGIHLPRRLIVLAPSHTGIGHPLGFWPDGAWETPLGDVPVDAGLGRELAAAGGGFAPDVRPHLREHDIEVLLPFLLTVQPALAMLPVVAGRPEGLPEAGRALAEVVRAHGNDPDGGVALIVSSDMNHYANEDENRRLDGLALDALLALDPQRLLDEVRRNNISMCGILPALMGLLACRELGAEHARLAAYDTSATASGDSSRVVGYAGVRIW